jgi:carboxylesterase
MVRIPVPAIDELMRITAMARRGLKYVRSPLCIIQSKQDQTVKPACAEEIYRQATAAWPKFLHWLERSDHVITMGVEQEEVFQLCQTFIATIVRDAAVKTVLPRDVHLH